MKDDRVIRVPEMVKKVGVSYVTLWRWEKDGEFPRRISLGGNSTGWLKSEYDMWLKSRAEARR